MSCNRLLKSNNTMLNKEPRQKYHQNIFTACIKGVIQSVHHKSRYPSTRPSSVHGRSFQNNPTLQLVSKLNAASYCPMLELHITPERFFQSLVMRIIMTLELQIKLWRSSWGNTASPAHTFGTTASGTNDNNNWLHLLMLCILHNTHN